MLRRHDTSCTSENAVQQVIVRCKLSCNVLIQSYSLTSVVNFPRSTIRSAGLLAISLHNLYPIVILNLLGFAFSETAFST